MRIGLVPILRPGAGGVYQYSLSLLRAVDGWRLDRSERDVVVFANSVIPEGLRPVVELGLEVVALERGRLRRFARIAFDRIVGEGRSRDQVTRLIGTVQTVRAARTNWLPAPPPPREGGALRTHEVDLAIFASADQAVGMAEPPFMVAVHDLQHRIHPEFPEVSAGGEWDRREAMYRDVLPRATRILVDSETGREDVLTYYAEFGVDPARIKILPFAPAPYLQPTVSAAERERVRGIHGLEHGYLFYPAQLWPHKNHARLARALAELRHNAGIRTPIVFSGTMSGDRLRGETLRYLRSLVTKLGLSDQVRFLGFVPDDDMSALYAEATALVMPTFFGPTNIPVVEAWALGCPVISSDLRGIREQIGDAGVLVDPASVESIADGILRVWSDDELRARLAERGRRRLEILGQERFAARLVTILEETTVHG